MPTPSISHKAVHQHDGKWWFWDETWADRLGPYPSYAIAAAAMWCYAHHLETGELYMVARVSDEAATIIREHKDLTEAELDIIHKDEAGTLPRCPICKENDSVVMEPCPSCDELPRLVCERCHHLVREHYDRRARKRG